MTNIMKKLQETVDNADCRIILKADLNNERQSEKLATFIAGMNIVGVDATNRVFFLSDNSVGTFYTLSFIADYQAGNATLQLIYDNWQDEENDECFGIACNACPNREKCGIE